MGNNRGAEQSVLMHKLVCTFVIQMQQIQIFLPSEPYYIGPNEKSVFWVTGLKIGTQNLFLIICFSGKIYDFIHLNMRFTFQNA